MRTRMSLLIVLALWGATAVQGQITSNPIPAPIEKRGLAVEIKDLVRLPGHAADCVRPIRTCRRPAGRA